jgi:hypothetical protein
VNSISKLWRTVLVLLLWAPIPLWAAIPTLAPAFLSATFIGVPFSVWLVVILTIVLVGFSWLFSAADDAEQRGRA